jgi:hemerythrin-like metal-binding protein
MPLYLRVIDHTVEHFAQEERWMLATGFAPENCHALQHASILETLQAVRTHTDQGDNTLIGRLAVALAEWFPQHAATMDAGLALHLQSLGYDTRTETLPEDSPVRPATMSGCGSVSCSG